MKIIVTIISIFLRFFEAAASMDEMMERWFDDDRDDPHQLPKKHSTALQEGSEILWIGH